MPRIILLITLGFFLQTFSPYPLQAQLMVASWNLCNMGKSKDAKELESMSKTLKNADLVCLQEINTGPDGAQAVAKLADLLNRSGSKWDYALSNPTNSAGSERYAFMWKTSKVKRIKPIALETRLDAQIDREPALSYFAYKAFTLLVATLHAVPKSKEPWRELKYLPQLQSWYANERLIITGDFNIPPSNTVFQSFRAVGWKEAIGGQKTTLKMEPKNGEHLANPYDQIWYDAADFVILKSGVLDFSPLFPTLKEARKISDHLPVYVELECK